MRRLLNILTLTLAVSLTTPLTLLADHDKDRGKGRRAQRTERTDRVHGNARNQGGRRELNKGSQGAGKHDPGRQPAQRQTVRRPDYNHDTRRPAHATAPGRPGHDNGRHNGWHNGQGGRKRPVALMPPRRPHRPVMARPHYRPVPPRAWRPSRGLPVVRTMLGLTFGTALGVSLDYLYGNGYTVDGYTGDIVYLRNVPVLNCMWTDGALYYGPSGLDTSSYYYSTPGYDMSRYNSVYSRLTGMYGQPVAVDRSGGLLTSTWFGGSGGFITLSFGAGQTGRFLTTLTMGL